MNVMMKCGHTAQAVDREGNPHCVICYGIHPGASVVESPPNLSGRFAVCYMCKQEKPSSVKLPFFEYTPAKDKDRFYCGCRGWD